MASQHEASPWQLGGLTARQLGARVWDQISADEVLDRAAALSYYFLFALFPGLLFLTALVGFLPIPDLTERLMGYVEEALPPDAASVLARTLGEIEANGRGGLLSLGALLALWTASGGMAALMVALNVAYGVDEPRPFWKRRLTALGLTLGFSIFLIVALALMAFGPAFGRAIAGWLGLAELFTTLWNVLTVPAAVVFVLVAIALVYYLAPASEQRWRWVTPGSAVAVLLWLVMSLALRFYMTSFGDYSATYGSIGGVILLMLWLYLTAAAVLIGAEVNSEIEHAAAAGGAATAKAPGQREVGPATTGPRRASGNVYPLHRPGEAVSAAPRTRGFHPADETDDVEMAAAAIAESVDPPRGPGWLAVLGFAAGTVDGWTARRPARAMASTARDTIHTGEKVTKALAAWERFRRERARSA
jgi:membrane protein